MKKIEITKVCDGVKYEIKKVSECGALSDETPCFGCELFADGVKIASVRNDGRGGSDIFDFTASAHVPTDYSARRGYELSLSTIIYSLLDLRAEVAALKRREKNALVLRKSDGSFCYVPIKAGRKTMKIADVIADPSGVKFISSMVTKWTNNGYEVLNTNI